MHSSSHKLRTLFIGFGHVGRQVARIITLERDQFPNLRDLELKVVGIVTRSHGSLVSTGGVDLTRALYEVESEGRFSNQNPQFSHIESLDAVETLDYDVLAELSALNIEENGEPALSYIERALRRGIHCVTANKGPIAFAYSDLISLAKSRDCALLFESTVMDGVPVFSVGLEGLRGCEILELEGILNSTTNFVLARMELGETMSDAVAMAQDLGFAEADPRYDLDGWDSAVKICLLANVLMDAKLTPLDVEREGITSLQEHHVQGARNRGKCLKLLARAWREGDRVSAEVKVRPVSQDSLFGLISGTASILRISTDLMGPLTICQEEPTLYDTAYGVLKDLLMLSEL